MSVGEKGEIISSLDKVSEDGTAIRITPANPLPAPIHAKQTPEIPKMVERLPEAPTDYSLNIWENLRLFIEHPIDSIHDIILQSERTAMSGIIKSIILGILALLAGHFGIGADAEVAGTSVESLITAVLYILAGLVLPQLRYLTPKWIREKLGWKDDA